MGVCSRLLPHNLSFPAFGNFKLKVYGVSFPSHCYGPVHSRLSEKH